MAILLSFNPRLYSCTVGAYENMAAFSILLFFTKKKKKGKKEKIEKQSKLCVGTLHACLLFFYCGVLVPTITMKSLSLFMSLSYLIHLLHSTRLLSLAAAMAIVQLTFRDGHHSQQSQTAYVHRYRHGMYIYFYCHSSII